MKSIKELAKERNISPWRLLEYFHEAGLPHDSVEAEVSFKDWKVFLSYIDEAREEEKSKEQARNEVKPVDNIILRVVVEIVRGLVNVVWAFIGIFFWIPLLARATTVFSIAIFSSVISGGSTYNAQTMLDKASKFYISGFIKINESISSVIDGKYIAASNLKRTSIKKSTVFFEALFSLIFWVLSVIAISSIFIDIGIVFSWIGDRFGDLWAWFGSIIDKLPNKAN